LFEKQERRLHGRKRYPRRQTRTAWKYIQLEINVKKPKKTKKQKKKNKNKQKNMKRGVMFSKDFHDTENVAKIHQVRTEARMKEALHHSVGSKLAAVRLKGQRATSSGRRRKGEGS